MCKYITIPRNKKTTIPNKFRHNIFGPRDSVQLKSRSLTASIEENSKECRVKQGRWHFRWVYIDEEYLRVETGIILRAQVSFLSTGFPGFSSGMFMSDQR